MSRILCLLLAALVSGPLACDDGSPDDDTADASESATGDESGETGDDAGDDSTGEAIDPTPMVPFNPPIARPCKKDDDDDGISPRQRDCDP
jgi:hypothetical protein